ncbi:hypothetical protein A2U01_0027414, partial [Trifolium medium]|nr:hypothetical protein [Trifolium medium]
MSQTFDSSQIKIATAEIVKTRSKSKKEASNIIVDAEPISTVPPTDSKKKKSSKSKEKTTKVSESSPSISNKSVSAKSKKKKPQSSVKRALSVHDLHVSEDPFGTGNVESHADTSVKTAIKPNVESSGKAPSEIEKPEIEKVVKETLISENPKSGETLDESRTNYDAVVRQSSMSVPVNVPVAASDKATPEIVDESVKEKNITHDAAQDVEASEDQINPNVAQDVG